MYAVIVTGGKQYRVRKDQIIDVEKLELPVGSSVEFDQVLMLGGEGQDCKIGKPVLKGCLVKAEVVLLGRQPKIRILKFRRRKHHMKRMGHRQWYTRLKITEIKAA